MPEPAGTRDRPASPNPATLSLLEHLLGQALTDGSRAAVLAGEAPATIDGTPVTVSLAPGSGGLDERPYALAARRMTPLVAIRGGTDPSDADEILLGRTRLDMARGLAGLVPRVVIGVPPLDAMDVLELADADFAVVLAADTGDHAADLHRTGHADHITASAEEVATLIQSFFAYLPASAWEEPPPAPPLPPIERDLLDVVPFAIDGAYEMEKVLQALLDGGRWLDLRSGTAPEVIAALARVGGRAVGLVASRPAAGRGRLTAAGGAKVAHCVRVCDAFHLPLVFLVDSEGLAAGSAGDRPGLAAVAAAVRQTQAATVPKCVVIAGRAYGLAALVLGAVGGRADYVGAWPRAELALDAPEDIAAQPDAPPAGELHERAAIMRAARSAVVLDIIHPDATRGVLIEMLDLLRGERTYHRVPKERTCA